MKEIRAKNERKVNAKTLIVAVDVGQKKNEGYYRCPDGRDEKPFEFDNDGQGFKEFWSRVLMAKKAYRMKEIMIGFESSGPYGEPLAHYLRKKPVKLVQVNPFHSRRVKELSDNSPNKTDRKDPRVIADIIQLGHALSLVVPEGAAAELRRLTQARERSMERRTALLNQLQQLVFILFPAFLRVMKNITTKSSRYLLRHYLLPRDILRCGVKTLSVVLGKVSRGQLGVERAKSLYEAAKTSVGVEEGSEGILLEVRNLMGLLEETDRFIAELEQKMSEHLEQIPYSKVILSIKGIGEVTTAGLIGEVGDFREFQTISEITKLAGLNLFEISSGKHKGRRRISKRGRSLMRKLLYFASLNVIRKGGILHGEYKRHLEKGMPKMKAMVAIIKKLLRIIFAMVRDGREYNTDIAKQTYVLESAA